MLHIFHIQQLMAWGKERRQLELKTENKVAVWKDFGKTFPGTRGAVLLLEPLDFTLASWGQSP